MSLPRKALAPKLPLLRAATYCGVNLVTHAEAARAGQSDAEIERRERKASSLASSNVSGWEDALASRRHKPQILGEKAYSCPHCEAIFPTATKEDQRRLGLHRILHVDYRDKRMPLSNALLGDQVDRFRLVAD